MTNAVHGPPGKAPNARIGEEIEGRYRIARVLGEGGMGTVYEALHVRIGRRVAVKFLQSALARNEQILARFRQEALAAGSLDHENIAAVTDFGFAADGSPYMAMEYLTGEDLASLLAREGPLPVPRAVFAAIQTCRGLDGAHSRGIVHRDLKPENLFVCRRADGSDLIKLLDFGIAKLRDPTGGVATQTGVAMGTPWYMSVEQARGARDVDLRTDIYALGVILYELLSGRKPHPGDTYNEIMYHILTQAPEPLEALRPGLPSGLVELVVRAMDNDPNRRPASAAEFARLLTPFAGRAVTPLQSQAVLPVAPSGAATMLAAEAALCSQPEQGHQAAASTEAAVTGEATAVPIRVRRKAGWLVGAIGLLVLAALAVVASRAGWRGENAAALPNSALPPSTLPATQSASPVPGASEDSAILVRPEASEGPSSTPASSAAPAGQTPGRPPGHRETDATPVPVGEPPAPQPPALPEAGTRNAGADAAPVPVVPTQTARSPRPYETSNPYE